MHEPSRRPIQRREIDEPVIDMAAVPSQGPRESDVRLHGDAERMNAGRSTPKKQPPGRSDPTGRSTGRDSEVTRPRRRQVVPTGSPPRRSVDAASSRPEHPPRETLGPAGGSPEGPTLLDLAVTRASSRKIAVISGQIGPVSKVFAARSRQIDTPESRVVSCAVPKRPFGGDVWTLRASEWWVNG